MCESPSAAGDSKLSTANAKPYIIVYQNVDPNAASTGKIDASKIIDALHSKYGTNASGFGMLDFESPFDQIIGAGPSSPKYAGAVNEMVQALKKVKLAFPNVRWTYYGIPGLLYYPSGHLWAFASQSEQQAEIDRQITNYGPVMMECDWYSPCIYDVIRNESLPNAEIVAQNAKNEYEYRIARMGVVKEFLKRNNLAARPIIPAASPFYSCGGNVSGMAIIPDAEFVSDQLKPAVDAADGIAIWAAPSYYLSVATQSGGTSGEQVEFRECFRKGLLSGEAPASWTTPEFKALLTDKVSLLLARIAELARNDATARRNQVTATVTPK